MNIRTAAQTSFQLTIAAFVLSMIACTSVPIREFTSYKQVFAEARTAGEQVLFDYSAAVKEYEQAKKLQAENSSAASTVSAVEIDRSANFDPATAAADAVRLDDVAVRIRAWDAVQRYNDVLLSLAEGKSVAQVSATVNGLMQSLATFPLEDIAKAASMVSPYVGVLREVLALGELERSRREFVSAVKKGAPLIGVPIRDSAESGDKKTFESFLKLLRDDARNFYNIRKGLNDLAYDHIVDEAAELRRQYRILILDYKSNPDLDKLTAAVNELLKSVGLPAIALSAAEKEQATEACTPIVFSQLIQIKEQIGAKVAAARKKTGELTAYKSMAAAYVNLIDQVSASLLALLTAVETDLKTTPPIGDLLPVYIQLRQAINFYRDSRGG